MPTRIFLYRMQTDAGSAPNIDGGVCSLAICKPIVRRTANIGDYIVGLRARSGEISKLGPHAVDSVLYVMRVTQKMSMEMYDTYCVAHLPVKIPGPDNEFRGDCQYTCDGIQRTGPHSPSHAAADLGGKYVLLGDTFWYRRSPAGVRLPAELADAWDVSAVARGHRTKTDAQLSAFVRWLTETAAEWA